MRVVFWIALIGIAYTYVGYPAAEWVLSRLRPRPWRTAPIRPGVSIILAVHNGIALLPGKIKHLRGLDYPNLKEIIVVSDGSTDGSAEFLAQQHHPRLKTIVLDEHRGKAVAVNAGMASATADILLFVDIRPEIAPGAIDQLVRNFADPQIGCVTGELVLRHDGHDVAATAISGLYWRYEQWIRTCESAVDSTVGVYGGFYAIRRKLATPLPAGLILDDMFQPLSVVRQGFRSVLDPTAHVYDTWPKEARREFHRKVRTLAGNFQLFQLAPWTLSLQNRVLFQIVSHKIARLIVPYLLILLPGSALMISAGSPLYTAAAAVQLFGLLLAVCALYVRIPIIGRIASPASALLVLNAAAIVGLYRFLTTRGALWHIWNAPPAQNSPPDTLNRAQFKSGAVAGPSGTKSF